MVRLSGLSSIRICYKLTDGGLSERPMELVLKTSEQKCFVGSNPTASAIPYLKVKGALDDLTKKSKTKDRLGGSLVRA